jgi:MFS family permease
MVKIMSHSVTHKGWVVTFGGTGINLALGILYTWSIFKAAIKKSIETEGQGAFNWDLASLNDPYAICCIVFAFAMILAGKCQDRFGPRITAFIGGLLVGIGFIWISQTTDYVSWVLGFGLLAGIGIGFGYAAATPPALKWFPPFKTGLIAGLVVSGFGLASVYIAPLSKYILGVWGLQNAMLFFGIAFLIVVCGLSMLLENPPAGYVPEGCGTDDVGQAANSVSKQNEATPSAMMKTPAFYAIWFIYFIGAGAGLMVIGNVAGMAKQSMGEMAFLVVAILAIGNASGRIIAGFLSDKIGRRLTLFYYFGTFSHLYWFQLWHKSFTFPFIDKRQLGAEEFWHKLRYCLYSLGCGWIRNGKVVADVDCQYGRLYIFLLNRNRPADRWCSPYFYIGRQKGQEVGYSRG